jgi:putative oxidoreductase
MNTPVLVSSVIRLVDRIGTAIQPVVLLAIRLYWGWSFFRTGLGKLQHLDKITEFFAGLGIPMPHANALVAGSVECFGGLLILVGFCSRLVAIPLIFCLGVAYATAERESLQAIFSDPDKFTGATPFLFLFAMLIVFAFGPGALSVDRLVFRRKQTTATTKPAVEVELANR